MDGPRVSQDAVADAQGHFSVKVQLVPGSNVFTIVATDTVTQRDSAQQTRTIEVDLSGGSPITCATGGADRTHRRRNAQRRGRTERQRARGDRGARRGAAERGGRPRLLDQDILRPGREGSGSRARQPGGRGCHGGSGRDIQRDAHAPPRHLADLRWTGVGGPIRKPAPTASPTTAASSAPGASISVKVTAAANLTGTLVIAGGPSYLLVLQDNVPLAGISGRTLTAGKSVALSAKQTLIVRAGNASAVTMTINGITIGTMGGSGEVIEWHISGRWLRPVRSFGTRRRAADVGR